CADGLPDRPRSRSGVHRGVSPQAHGASQPGLASRAQHHALRSFRSPDDPRLPKALRGMGAGRDARQPRPTDHDRGRARVRYPPRGGMGGVSPSLEGPYRREPQSSPRRLRRMLKILGYPDRYGVPQGGEIRFMVSLEEGDAFDARLVSIINGASNPAGPGFKVQDVDVAANGRYRGGRQVIDAGSYMVAPTVPPLPRFTFRGLV